MSFATISFYKYFPVKSPEEQRDYCRSLCKSLQLTGRILIAAEGINAAVSGKKENIEEFKHQITKHPLFSNLTFRQQDADTLAHHKLIVRVRKEIVHFGTKVDLTKPGIHLSPTQLQQWYEDKEDFVMVDARNEYEHKVGKFRGAMTLPINNFREFPQVAVQQLQSYQDQKIVLYCTGGIRCEKASAYLKEQGFGQVYQIDGGIINYINQFPHSYWEGGLFVFDDRLVSDVGEPITHCQFCQKECGQYHNCFNLDCDELFIACDGCRHKMNTTCSQECQNAPRKRKEFPLIPLKTIGRVESYFSKAGVALVKLQEEIGINTTIHIRGNTTAPFTQHIGELRDEGGNEVKIAESGELVTFPISSKVRKNDLIFLSDY